MQDGFWSNWLVHHIGPKDLEMVFHDLLTTISIDIFISILYRYKELLLLSYTNISGFVLVASKPLGTIQSVGFNS